MFDVWPSVSTKSRRRLPADVTGNAEPQTVHIDGRVLVLRLRRHPRARRLTLRLASDGVALIITLPPRAPEHAALALIEQHRQWIGERLGRLPPRVPFVDGAEIPLRGTPHRLRHRPGPSAPITAIDGWLDIPGGPAFAGRLTGWLKGEARRELSLAVREKARRLGRPVGLIRIGDPRSRWGSCAANGTLSFSWRLILAPPPVLDYVAAHEVAHLLIPRHDASFWRLNATLTDDVAGARRWLKRHGAALFGYGGGESAP